MGSKLSTSKNTNNVLLNMISIENLEETSVSHDDFYENINDFHLYVKDKDIAFWVYRHTYHKEIIGFNLLTLHSNINLYDSKKIIKIAEHLKKNYDVNEIDESGNTPLYYVKSYKLFIFLLMNGGDINYKNFNGKGILCKRKSEKIVKHILKLATKTHSFVELNSKDEHGKSILMYFLEFNYSTCVIRDLIFLLQRRSFPEVFSFSQCDNNGNNVLYYIKTYELLKYVIQNYQTINILKKNNKSQTLLYDHNKSLNAIKYLIEMVDLNINDKDIDGNTPLMHYLKENVSLSKIMLLLKCYKNIDSKLKNNNNEDTYEVAKLYYRRFREIELFLWKGINSKIYESDSCLICLNETNVLNIMVPCGHMTHCKKCFLLNNSFNCIVCRCPISEIYLSNS